MKQTSLLGIAKKAASDKAHRFQNLIGLLSLGYLLACWRLINKRAACGVDRQDARAYEQKNEGQKMRVRSCLLSFRWNPWAGRCVYPVPNG